MCVINWIGSSDDWALAIHRKNEKELLKYKMHVWFYTSFSYTEVCKIQKKAGWDQAANSECSGIEKSTFA